MKKKIVFFDIDGTIYRFDTGIPNDVMESISKLKKNGHIPVICTGRTRCMIYPEFLTPGFDYIIAGAGTYVEVNGKQTYLSEMENKDIKYVEEEFINNGFVPVAEGRDNIFIGDNIEHLTEHTKRVMATYYDRMGDKVKKITDKGGISKISALFTTKSNVSNMVNTFKDDYSIINHNNMLLEVIKKPYNKAYGIKNLIDYLKVDIEDTYAFGDSFNDLDMLQFVKYGCAMGNSDKDLFDLVPYRTDDFDKGGITTALKKFGLI